jgi:hypothetical protein
MKLVREGEGSVRLALFLGLGFLVLGIVVEYIAILRMNSGVFTYTLDDPYIHLALAENISNGHYGVNASEFSAPSSSILWPFILALFASVSHFVYTPLFLNTIASMLVVFFFYRILEMCLKNTGTREKKILISFFIVLLILGTNVIGLVFTGMEHSLQMLSVVLILWGLILEIETGKLPHWFVVAVVIAPLIRYESLAVSGAAILYLAFRKYFKYAVALTVAIVVLLGLFSLFLIHSGLEPLPTSVLCKSATISSGGDPLILLRNFVFTQNDMSHTLSGNGGSASLVLSCALLSLLSYTLFSSNKDRERLLAGVVSLALTLLLIFGENGWFFRYEVYIWTFSVLTLLYLISETLLRRITSKNGKLPVIKMVAMASLIIYVLSMPYISALASIRLASNNIFQQHYQMHRFAVDYYNQPVAVGDLGYVAFQNDNYVLDLTGLASIKALNYRKNGEPADWMNILAEENGVRYAMIYESSFHQIPDNWIKMGALHLGRQAVTAFGSEVSFYAIGTEVRRETEGILREFTASLPEDVTFVYCDQERY